MFSSVGEIRLGLCPSLAVSSLVNCLNDCHPERRKAFAERPKELCTLGPLYSLLLRGSSLHPLRLKAFPHGATKLQDSTRPTLHPGRQNPGVTSETPRTHIESQDVRRTAPPPRCCSRTTLSDPTGPQNDANHIALCGGSQSLHKLLNATLPNFTRVLWASFRVPPVPWRTLALLPCPDLSQSRYIFVRGSRGSSGCYRKPSKDLYNKPSTA
jgi:hypothetical protein